MPVESARFTNPEHTMGVIVIDGVEHHGPIPSNAGDVQRELEAWLAEGGVIAPYVEPPPPAPGPVSDRQFFQQLAKDGAITPAEALAAVQTGAIPAALAGAIATLPEDQQFDANMLIAGATTFERTHPMVPLLGAALGKDTAALDEIWRNAATL